MGDNAPGSGAAPIEIRISEISQLFHTLDPYPFCEKDLDEDAEEYIVGWARELPRNSPLRILVHLPTAQAARPEAGELGLALCGYFGRRAEVITLDLKELFRIGRRSLAIGLTVLSICTLTSQTIATNLQPQPVGRFIEESLIIFGWVANWRPIEIFLYDWWPLVRRRDLYRRLSSAIVELKPYESHANN
jgi:hypothetical protein